MVTKSLGERRQEGEMDSGKLWGVLDVFIILIVEMVSWVNIYVKIYQIIHFKCVVYCVSVIPQLRYFKK